ncbi:hypothetical protein RJ639_029889 [Escallonia herrerae]|uniref:DUF632 domain-containing protein n=1 Tax=Escallonia herrerae TaxID=1293975 RepID=A0AA89BH04_9ASTE|nr:hypothetical protein RJ639_029889 [Escallonia herrerae]
MGLKYSTLGQFLCTSLLRKMWEVMFECHKHQFQIVSVAYIHRNPKISLQSDIHRQIIVHLENELSSLSSTFTKWIAAQNTYVEDINGWLNRCVSLQQKHTKRKRRVPPPPLRDYGPPIYVTCGVWLDKLVTLPTKEVADSIKGLTAELTHFLPRQDKSQGKGVNSDLGVNLLRDEASEEWISGFDRFRSSLVSFLAHLSNFAGSSVTMFTELQKSIEEAKIRCGQQPPKDVINSCCRPQHQPFSLTAIRLAGPYVFVLIQAMIGDAIQGLHRDKEVLLRHCHQYTVLEGEYP